MEMMDTLFLQMGLINIEEEKLLELTKGRKNEFWYAQGQGDNMLQDLLGQISESQWIKDMVAKKPSSVIFMVLGDISLGNLSQLGDHISTLFSEGDSTPEILFQAVYSDEEADNMSLVMLVSYE